MLIWQPLKSFLKIKAARVVPERFQPLIDETRPLAGRFAAAGHRIYLVAAFPWETEPVNYRLDRMNDLRVSENAGHVPGADGESLRGALEVRLIR